MTSTTSISIASSRTAQSKPVIKHIFQLGTNTSISSSERTAWTTDKCLIVFPNYVTGGLISAECMLAVRPQVEYFLKYAHAERARPTPPIRSLTERTAAELLLVSISTLHSYARKGLLYRWLDARRGWLFSNAEVQALILAEHRITR
ncbi:MAG: hypothetical protein EOO61_07420 [Hymenobacter sp.]|nr:MAG: hypothetical protein EOO61_07420 [Hymenobacter sp.]